MDFHLFIDGQEKEGFVLPNINVTKNKLIEALNYLGEFPKTSLKKEELIKMLDEIYGENIEK